MDLAGGVGLLWRLAQSSLETMASSMPYPTEQLGYSKCVEDGNRGRIEQRNLCIIVTHTASSIAHGNEGAFR
ncbi:hypothetical protein EJ05DRAFT_475624 [Pseudovirgaria hyperparasitica]|uniref:Uncharacterized protein n=1 Tax=Pseudovirgaria hyperparasitica TaxID=470096 RepID=A0A6A6WB62_9PEZI|nr:uncharacterized protein EJ05DRAFT_475624 [Pseudovirgaria hyperparasitica]KAF2759419.1 hypothetical protein EJ05DRAFT_475624 [Pseudovirgaria hyperparasitica]